MKKIIEFLEHYQEEVFNPITKPLKSLNLLENGVDEWSYNFIDNLSI